MQQREMGMEKKEEGVRLFVTKKEKGQMLYRAFATTVFLGIVSVWCYRWIHVPETPGVGRVVWLGMFAAELWFGLYWIVTQSVRWTRIRRRTFPDRLSRRYEDKLPGVDIYLCTADAALEPPIMVVNTVLSVMSYDYPPEKITVYLSDDGGSMLTYYAMLEASFFSHHWLPYCKLYDVQPRAPEAYFRQFNDAVPPKELVTVKKLYEEMKDKIETATMLGRIPEDVLHQHSGFSKWNSFSSRHDHPTILSILIDGRDQNAKDVEGCRLPTLVYMAREKRPNYQHNFKAGAMNSLIRVSSKISNAQIILNVDCDMYSNNSRSIRDALCFLMDEEKGHKFAFVQFPQNFENITTNDLYGASLLVIREVEFCGLDGHGGPMYIGSGCFHRREALCGQKFSSENKIMLRSTAANANDKKYGEESLSELEESVKGLADISYEKNNTQWGNKMGLKYGFPVEDVITGLSIQTNGWRSVYFSPDRKAFLGVAPNTLDQNLVQQKRWSEGDLQILISKYSPIWCGIGKIHPALIMGYSIYCLWALNSLPVLYYSIVPTLCLLKGIYLFPQMSSPWFPAFAYVITAVYTHSILEYLWSGGSVRGWWNEQRMWLYKRTSSYLFALVDTMLKLVGFSESGFIISPKHSDESVSRRYKQEIMEFGVSSSPMFTVLSSIALLNLFCFVWTIAVGVGIRVFESMALQILLCGGLNAVNLPLYNALFLRKDEGKMPTSIAFKSLALALLVSSCFAF